MTKKEKRFLPSVEMTKGRRNGGGGGNGKLKKVGFEKVEISSKRFLHSDSESGIK